MLHSKIIKQQRLQQVFRNHTLVLIADYKQSIVADQDLGWQ
jgi:hypothetical protein